MDQYLKDWIKVFDEHRTKKAVAKELGHSRPTLDLKLEMSNFDFKKWKRGEYKNKMTIHVTDKIPSNVDSIFYKSPNSHIRKDPQLDDYYENLPIVDNRKIDVVWLFNQIKENKEGWLKDWCKGDGGVDSMSYNAVKEAIYKYSLNPNSLFKTKKKVTQKKKPKILTMNDIDLWLDANPNNIITRRLKTARKSGRNVWKDQYSKFADLLTIVNLIK